MIDVFHHLIHEHSDKENELYKKIHQKKWIQLIDKYVYLIAFIGILGTLPQLYTIWVVREVAGVSVISWTGYTLSALLWTLYGFGHKERVITVTNMTFFFMNLLVVVGVLFFK